MLNNQDFGAKFLELNLEEDINISLYNRILQLKIKEYFNITKYYSGKDTDGQFKLDKYLKYLEDNDDPILYLMLIEQEQDQREKIRKIKDYDGYDIITIIENFRLGGNELQKKLLEYLFDNPIFKFYNDKIIHLIPKIISSKIDFDNFITNIVEEQKDTDPEDKKTEIFNKLIEWLTNGTEQENYDNLNILIKFTKGTYFIPKNSNQFRILVKYEENVLPFASQTCFSQLNLYPSFIDKIDQELGSITGNQIWNKETFFKIMKQSNDSGIFLMVRQVEKKPI